MATNEATNPVGTATAEPNKQTPPTGAESAGTQPGSGDELKHHLNQLRQDFGVLRQDVMDVLESLFDVSKEKTGEARERAIHTGKRALDATESQIRERPVIAVVMAMILGMLMATFMNKSRS